MAEAGKYTTRPKAAEISGFADERKAGKHGANLDKSINLFHTNRWIFLFLLIPTLVWAQTDTTTKSGKPDKGPRYVGKFYVSVDDEADLLLNGEVLYHAGLNESVSPEVTLKPSDHVVARLSNSGDARRFALLFVTNNQQTAVSFTSNSFKIIPGLDAKDFTTEDYPRFRYAVTNFKNKAKPFAYKSTSAWVWGEQEKCVLGSLLEADWFKPLQK